HGAIAASSRAPSSGRAFALSGLRVFGQCQTTTRAPPRFGAIQRFVGGRDQRGHASVSLVRRGNARTCCNSERPHAGDELITSHRAQQTFGNVESSFRALVGCDEQELFTPVT